MATGFHTLAQDEYRTDLMGSDFMQGVDCRAFVGLNPQSTRDWQANLGGRPGAYEVTTGKEQRTRVLLEEVDFRPASAVSRETIRGLGEHSPLSQAGKNPIGPDPRYRA